jgi:transcription termination/antitermination protein NusA
MAREQTKDQVDLNESSVYGRDADDNAANDRGDTADEDTLDRLEEITGGADEPGIYEGALGRKIDELDAETDEEVDALELDLLQDEPRTDTRDGTGRIVDELAEEEVAEFTEVGPDVADRGARSVAPSLDDTSSILRRHHPNTSIARSQDVVEGNLDEPRDEERGERKVDEGTAG